MPRWAIAGTLVLLVGLAAWLIPTALAKQSAATEASRPIPSRTQTPSPTPTEKPVAAFLGDSYTVGARATEQERWTSVVSAQLGWRERNFGFSDTGYLDAGSLQGGAPYKDRIPDIKSYSPAIVVVSGGRNDIGRDQAEVDAAIRDTFQMLRAALPKAQIVAVSPWWGAVGERPQLVDIGATVKAAVEDVGGVYLDTGQPLAGHPEWMHEDGVHPIAAGYAALAAAFVDQYGKLPAAS